MSQIKPILHIVVVGFHHKKGCQVEFSYPPLILGTQGKSECPSGWKYLPTLALPDGSHNFTEDSVFFNLPSLVNPTDSIYGVSCYRQIPVEKLKIRTADVTRSTVQKSVCILSSLPLYGYIEVKLALIADAFFEQGDFSCTDLLVKAYDQLNACLCNEPLPMRHVHVGLSLRDIILKWRNKSLLLFKLLLLQKRVVCFSSPVGSMCSLILGICSLHPKLIEKGFTEVACVRTSRPMSPMPDFSIMSIADNSADGSCIKEEKIIDDKSDIENEKDLEVDKEKIEKDYDSIGINNDALNIVDDKNITRELIRADSNGTEVGKRGEKRSSLTRDASVDTLASTLFPLSSICPDAWSAPIPIFSSGHLCLPYLSLPYMDLLSDPSVLSYVIGTSNILFHQKKNLADIQIDVEAGTIDTSDQELRRQLILTTEDLRFIDFIIRHVQNPKEDAEGSERWIRDQFQGYSLALLRTALTQENTKDCEHFNNHFVSAWKKTQCFEDWLYVKPDIEFFDTVPGGHPFSGTLSVADMKLKIAQTMHNSESGRKINQAVNTTSRAVGGALSQAKGAFSNWWSSMTTTSANQQHLNQNTTFPSDKVEDNTELNLVDNQTECESTVDGDLKNFPIEKLNEDSKNSDIQESIETAKEAESLDDDAIGTKDQILDV